MSHFPFNLPLLVIYANAPKATQIWLTKTNMSKNKQNKV
jgi:hypothetical protein